MIRPRQLTLGPQTRALRQNLEPERWNLVQIRAPTALFRADTRPIELSADHGRPPEPQSSREMPELPPH